MFRCLTLMNKTKSSCLQNPQHNWLISPIKPLLHHWQELGSNLRFVDVLVCSLPASICSFIAMQIIHHISQHSKFNQEMSSLICTDMHWWTGFSRSMNRCLSNDHQFWRRNGAIPLLFYSICFIICSQEHLLFFFFLSFSGFPFVVVTASFISAVF